ncbi:MAG TPA: malto-oligosyltrehalose synthase [Terriglobales bacterium]|nr:malto-oligosyltrehalose synthase [Terriglobales bacterium]
MEHPPQIPTATYRLQLNRTFTFRGAAAIVPYLSDLGISHCYMSPYLRARPGSMHGYDIIDHNSLNPEIGTVEDYEYLVAELQRHGMGQILDIVPNHMGVMGSDNAWWLDVLENGEASEYADFFDIDWDPIKEELQGKVLVPILADQYGNVLENGDLKLVFDCDRGEFSIFYHEHRFPIDPTEYPRILNPNLDGIQQTPGAGREDFLELQSISTAFSHLPARGAELTPERRAERAREKEVQKRRLASLCSRSPDVHDFLKRNVEQFNGHPDDPHSYDALHELIKVQAFRLAQWRSAADDINYRRFFDINDLAALRVENDAVFASTHRLILDLVTQRKIQGLRIDHPDGLYDPLKYFQRLNEQVAASLGNKDETIYIIAEKILTGKEQLRANWPLDGTTGYDFANLVNGLFVSQDNADKVERIYRSFTSKYYEFTDLEYACKKLILKLLLSSELNVLATILSRIALANRHTCDFTLNSLRSALSEVIACFPVYRTYVRCTEVSSDDRRYVDQAVREAIKRSNIADLSVFEFVRKTLLVEIPTDAPQVYKKRVVRFAMKFQQVTAAVIAKGLEDTAFYRYNRLISLNEVAGSPSKFGTSIDDFHRANRRRLADWPHSMLASSTHDSKRSADVRARINVLSEIPAEWRLRLRRWREWNRDKKHIVDGEIAPTMDHEYLLYQTLLGACPNTSLDDAAWHHFIERIEQYLLKAAREAKDRTSWANPNQPYEQALSLFVRAILDNRHNRSFLADFRDFQFTISRVGAFNTLSQTLLKLTSPGVPDTYQGTEFLDLSLVDPDNRRPVDYDARQRSLEQLKNMAQSNAPPSVSGEQSTGNSQASQLKQLVIWKTLTLRRQEPLLFERGNYVPLSVSGTKAKHLVAFARTYEDKRLIVAVPRLCATLLGGTADICQPAIWGATNVDIGSTKGSCYHDLFTGNCISAHPDVDFRLIPVATLLRSFPVALLISEPKPC